MLFCQSLVRCQLLWIAVHYTQCSTLLYLCSKIQHLDTFLNLSVHDDFIFFQISSFKMWVNAPGFKMVYFLFPVYMDLSLSIIFSGQIPSHLWMRDWIQTEFHNTELMNDYLHLLSCHHWTMFINIFGIIA